MLLDSDTDVDDDDVNNKSSDSVPLDLADFSCVVCGCVQQFAIKGVVRSQLAE